MKFSIKELNLYIPLKELGLDNHYSLIRECLYNGYPLQVVSYLSNLTEIVCITNVQKHPNADQLKLYSIITSNQSNHTIVSGDLTLKVGDRVIWAMPGAKLQDTIINIRKIRGIESNGMLCSAQELALDYNNDGILCLNHILTLGKVPLDQINLFYKAEIPFNRKELKSIKDLANDIKNKYYNINENTPDAIKINPNTCNMILGYVPKQTTIDDSSKQVNKLLTIKSINSNAEIAGEIARIYGYENIPLKPINFTFTKAPQTLLEKFRDFALTLGFDEVLCRTISNIGTISLLNNKHKKLRNSFEESLIKYAQERFNMRIYNWIGIFTYGNCFSFEKNNYLQIHKLAFLLNNTLHKNLKKFSIYQLIFELGFLVENNQIFDSENNIIGYLKRNENYDILEINLSTNELVKEKLYYNYYNCQEFNRDLTFNYFGNIYNLLQIFQNYSYPKTSVFLIDSYQEKFTFRIIGPMTLDINKMIEYYTILGKKHNAIYNE